MLVADENSIHYILQYNVATIALNICGLMNEKNISLRDLSKASGVKKKNIKKMMNGDEDYRIDHLIKVLFAIKNNFFRLEIK